MKILANAKLIGQIIIEMAKLTLNAIHFYVLKVFFKIINAQVKIQDKILSQIQAKVQKINWKLEVEKEKIPVKVLFPLLTRLYWYSRLGVLMCIIESVQIKLCKKLHLIKNRG